jgi:hypothetical protein
MQCNGDVMCEVDPTTTAPPPSAGGSLSQSVVVALSPYLFSLTRSLPVE